MKHTFLHGLPNIPDCYKYSKKMFEMFGSLNNQTTQNNNTDDNLNYVPANGHDMANYIAKYGLGNFQIQVILKLDCNLDYEKLAKAVRLSIDAEPILGCRFIAKNPPYWKHWDNIDKIEFCSFEETENSELAVEKFIRGPLSMSHDPMVKVKLIRWGLTDTLCVKMNHTCTDGGGAKEYIQLLSDIYSRICYGEDDFEPTPSLRDKKDHYELFNAFGVKDPLLAKSPPAAGPMPLWMFRWKNTNHKSIRIVDSRLSPDKLEAISGYAKSKGATINDLILTAYFREMFDRCDPPYDIPLSIGVSIDLRRFLPDKKATAIRNFTGGIHVHIPRKKDESFEETLSRVMEKTQKIKDGNVGLDNAIAAEQSEKMNYSQTLLQVKAVSQFLKMLSAFPVSLINICAPGLSNVGVISKTLLKFGNATILDYYVVAPAVKPPTLLLVASSYNGTLTLSVSYYKGTISRKCLQNLLNKITNQLVEYCSQ